jgi:hypothetical protein
MQITLDGINKINDLRSRLLLIKPRAFDLDELVVSALDETKAHFRRTMPKGADEQGYGDGHADESDLEQETAGTAVKRST